LEIIGDARLGARDDEHLLRRIAARLRRLKPEEHLEFEAHFHRILAQSYSWSLWGAAYLMCGAADDSLDYFRAWLARSRRVS